MHDTNSDSDNNRRSGIKSNGYLCALVFGLFVTFLGGCCSYVLYLNAPNPEVEKRLAQVTLTLGTPLDYTVNTVGTAGIHIAKLDNTHLIALYFDSTDSDLKAVVFSVSGTTFTGGTPVQVDGSVSNSSFDIAAVSSSKAIAVYTDSGGDVVGKMLTISGTTISSVGALNTIDAGANSVGNTQAISVTNLSSTEAIVAYKDDDNGGAGSTKALDISGDVITAGAIHVFDASNTFQMSASAINTTQAVVTYLDAGSTPANRGASIILTKTGAVMSSGSQTLFTALGISNAVVGALTGTSAVVGYRDSAGSLSALVLSISGTTITANAATAIDVAAVNSAVGISKIDNNTVVVTYRVADNDTWATEAIISGTTVTGDTPIEVSAANGLVSDAAVYLSPNVAIIYGDNVVAVTSSNAVSPNIADPAPMSKPCSISPDGDFIYLAGLNADTFPVIIKISTALNADGTLVYDPGVGSDIGVECGKFDNDVVWAAGVFDGVSSTVKSEDGGDSFAFKDTQFAQVTAFKVGPDSDDRVLVVDDTIDIYETEDDGATWDLINDAIGHEVKAIARLDKNVEETVFGNEAAAANNIEYSVNSGADLEDYTSGFDQEVDVLSLEVG